MLDSLHANEAEVERRSDCGTARAEDVALDKSRSRIRRGGLAAKCHEEVPSSTGHRHTDDAGEGVEPRLIREVADPALRAKWTLVAGPGSPLSPLSPFRPRGPMGPCSPMGPWTDSANFALRTGWPCLADWSRRASTSLTEYRRIAGWAALARLSDRPLRPGLTLRPSTGVSEDLGIASGTACTRDARCALGA
jgi:hypothetical protein